MSNLYAYCKFILKVFFGIRNVRFLKPCLYFTLSCYLLLPLIATAQEKTLNVGVSLGAPFVIFKNNEYEGISIDIWKLISEELNLKYQFIPMGEHIDDAIEDLSAGKIDILIGPIVPTYERSKLVDFMQPYYSNKIGLVVALKRIDFFEAISPIFNVIVNISLIIFLVFFVLYLHVYWYYERIFNNKLPLTYWKGIRKTFWLHTLDIDLGKIPEHVTTRIFRFLWLTLLTLFFSSITAAITSALTIALSDQYMQYDSLDDFRNKKIAAVISTAPYDIAKGMGLNIVPTNSREDAINLLLSERVTAYADYYPIADYYIKQHQLSDKLMMANAILKRNTFAFALPINSPLLHELNLKLRSHQDYGVIKSLCEKYFGENSKSVGSCEL